MSYYIQLDENNICIGISELSAPIENDRMIQIEEFSADLLGKKYENGEFLEVESTVIPESPPEITNTQVLQVMNDLRADLEIAGVI